MRQSHSSLVVRALLFAAVFTVLLWSFVRFPVGLMRGLAGSWLLLLVSLFLLWVFRHFWDHESIASLGFSAPGKLTAVVTGLLLGAVLTGLIFGVEYAAGWIEVTGVKSWSAGSLVLLVLLLLAGNLATAVTEETVFRGYILQNLEKGMGTTGAVILSSLIFGSMHLLNLTARGWAVYVIPVSLNVFGVLLASAYLVGRSLWLPIALHLSWNMCEYDILGLTGQPLGSAAFIGTRLTGPPLWVGLSNSSFGPEVGLLGFLAALLGIALLLWLRARRRSARGPYDLSGITR